MQRFEDALGPRKVVRIWEPSVGLRAFVVVDNVAIGPAIGGVRMAEDVSEEEVFRLARAMTFKNAAAGLPHGGGKAGIAMSPDRPPEEKQRLIRAFARAIEDLTEYIPGPDMGTDETCMAWVRDEIGRAVGLPEVLGGIPLDVIGATGHGLAVAAEVAAPVAGVDLRGARVAVQGFGAVGRHAAHYLAERGAILVAASDSRVAVVAEGGIDVEALAAHKAASGSLAGFEGVEAMDRDSLVRVPCDIWIPAARPDVLTRDNVAELTCKLVLQGANIPATAEAEAWMHEHGILSVPDFVANAGGVICAAVEYHGGTRSQAMAVIAEKVRRNTQALVDVMRRRKVTPREAATEMARARIDEARAYRR